MPALHHRNVLLTGASGGIGAAIAHRLAGEGARLWLVGRNADTLERLRSALPAAASHRAVIADLASNEGRDFLARTLEADGSPLDALVHAAGISRFAWLADTPPDALEAQFATNLVAPVLLTQRLLPRLAPRGRILFLGSSFGGIGYPGFSAYCASKFALRGFTEALRRELADTGVQVAYLAPRATRTALNSPAVCAMNDALGNATDPPERVADAVARMLAAPRMCDRALGWPERLFLRLNAVFPALVDGALRKQLPAIKRFAAPGASS